MRRQSIKQIIIVNYSNKDMNFYFILVNTVNSITSVLMIMLSFIYIVNSDLKVQDLSIINNQNNIYKYFLIINFKNNYSFKFLTFYNIKRQEFICLTKNTF